MTAHSSPQPPSDDAPNDKQAEKRGRILVAAEKVFARSGFFAAKVSEIAKEANVADGTIYLYFKNKDDLLISLFESRVEHVNAVLTQAIAAHPEPADQMAALIRTYLRLVQDQPAVAEVLTIELRQSSKFMKEYSAGPFAELLRIISGIIARGQDQGVFVTATAAPLLARMIFGMLDELALAWLLLPETSEPGGPGHGKPSRTKFELGQTAESAVAFVLQGLLRRK